MEKQSDEKDLKSRESQYGIVTTEIEMVKNNRWLSDAERAAKINELQKLIKK